MDLFSLVVDLQKELPFQAKVTGGRQQTFSCARSRYHAQYARSEHQSIEEHSSNCKRVCFIETKMKSYGDFHMPFTVHAVQNGCVSVQE